MILTFLHVCVCYYAGVSYEIGPKPPRRYDSSPFPEVGRSPNRRYVIRPMPPAPYYPSPTNPHRRPPSPPLYVFAFECLHLRTKKKIRNNDYIYLVFHSWEEATLTLPIIRMNSLVFNCWFRIYFFA